MPTYIYLTSWTDQGAQDPKSAVERASTAVQGLESMGVKIFEVYWTSGPYDLVMVAECDDEATAYAARSTWARAATSAQPSYAPSTVRR